MKPDKKQLPQIIIMAVLVLLLITIGYTSLKGGSSANTPPPAPLKAAAKESLPEPVCREPSRQRV